MTTTDDVKRRKAEMERMFLGAIERFEKETGISITHLELGARYQEETCTGEEPVVYVRPVRALKVGLGL